MERAGYGEALRADPPRLEEHLNGIDGAGMATDHRLLGRVLGTHPYLSGERRDRRGNLLATGDHREHRSLLRTELVDGGGTGLRRPRALGEAPGPGSDERWKLAEAVAGDHVGRESHPLEHRPGKQVAEIHPPLGVPHRRAHPMVRLPGDAGEGLEARRPGLRVECLERLSGRGRLREQAAEHVGVLRSLPREQGRHERAPSRQRLHAAWGRGDDRSRRDGVRLPRRRRHRESVVHDDMAHLGLIDDGDRPGPIAAGIDRRHGHRLRRGDRHSRQGSPGRHGRRHPSRLEDLGELDHPGRGRRRPEMADKPLDRPTHRCDPVFAGQGAEFGLVDVTRSRAGHLERRHGARHDPRLKPCRADGAGRGLGDRRPRSHRHAANHTMDAIPRGAGIGEALEHQDDRSLTGNAAVAGGVEGRARAIGEHPLEREALVGHEVEIALAGGAEHGVAVALAEEIDSRRERRDAGAVPRVERERPSHEIERLRQPAGERGAREAPRLVDQCRHLLEEFLSIALDDPLDVARRDPPTAEGRAEVAGCFRQAEPHLEIVGELAAEHRPHHDAGADAIERGHPADFGDRGIGSLEQHELERVGRSDLLRWHLVPAPVVDEPLDEATHPGDGVPGPGGPRIERPGHVEARRRHRDDRRLPLADERPEGVDGQGTGKNAADADDRHRFVVSRALRHRRQNRRGARGEMLGERQMDVEAADPEGVHRGPAGFTVGPLRPWDRLTGNDERASLPVEVFVVFAASRAGRDEPVLHREHDLDEARHAGGLEGVADVRLHAADRDLPPGRNVRRDERRQGTELGRIADLGARGMGFDVVEAADFALVGIGPLDSELLPFLTRRPQALPLAVTRHADATDDRPDPIAVGDRLGELLDHQRHIALGRHQAVGITAEGARAGVAHRLCGRKQHEAVRLAVGSPADDRLIDPPLLERASGDGEGLERRGTGGVDDEVGAVEVERFADDLRGPEGSQVEFLPRTAAGVVAADRGGDLGGDGVRPGAEKFAGRFDVAEPGGRAVDPGGIDVVADPSAAAGVADVDAGARPTGHGEGIKTGIAAGQRRHLEEDVVGDVVAIEHVGTDRTDGRIGRTLTDDRPQIGVALADLALLGIEVQVAGEAGVGQPAPGGAAMHHEVPESVQAIGPRKPAGHADNRQ